MPKAIWNGQVVAESQKTEVVDGNHYFPADSLKQEFLVESPTKTNCPWKGDASYYSLRVGDQVNEDAAWCYVDPKPAAANIRGYVAFWKGVQVET